MALRSDPRISYAAYIPDAHYPPHEDAKTRLPLIVAIHGTSRGYHRHLAAWKDFADTHRCAVVTPLFPAMLQGPLDGDGYHYLGRQPAIQGGMAKALDTKLVKTGSSTNPELGGNDIRYDHILLDILDEVSIRWPAIDTSRIFLTGFSGGGQCVHRFAYLHANRIVALAIGAPGTATKIDLDVKWPLGTADFDTVFSQPVNIEALRKVPTLAVVGGEDTQSRADLRRMLKGEKFVSGEDVMKTRVDALTELVQNWRENGVDIELVVVPGVGHNMEGCNGPVVEFMEKHVTEWWATR